MQGHVQYLPAGPGASLQMWGTWLCWFGQWKMRAGSWAGGGGGKSILVCEVGITGVGVVPLVMGCGGLRLESVVLFARDASEGLSAQWRKTEEGKLGGRKGVQVLSREAIESAGDSLRSRMSGMPWKYVNEAPESLPWGEQMIVLNKLCAFLSS